MQNLSKTFNRSKNPFATTTKNENRFVKKEKSINLTECEFPQLSSISLPIVPSKSNLDFNSLSFQENERENVEKNKQPMGWVQISFDKNNSGNVQYESSALFHFENAKNNADEYFAESANFVINGMIQRWEVYREKYNELFGDDECAYENYYKIDKNKKYLDETDSECDYSSNEDE